MVYQSAITAIDSRRSDMPAVSVVIPVYNRASTIARALLSVVAQTIRDLEIIVVDDASTDGTVEVIRQINDPRVICIACDTNGGAAAARNRGIAAATGSYIAFLDSDDYWDPDKLERQLKYFEIAPPDVLVVCCSFRVMHAATGRTVERLHAACTDWRMKMLDVCCLAPGSTMIARRSVFQTIGIQDPLLRQFEDWDWFIRYLHEHSLLVMPESLATINTHQAPDPVFTEQQAAHLYALRKQDILEDFGEWGLKRFRASMHVEHAVACVRYGRFMAAAMAIMRATMLSPNRVYALIKRAAFKALAKDY
jgi:glycosyltransferase involved in cell wall biosynthesis